MYFLLVYVLTLTLKAKVSGQFVTDILNSNFLRQKQDKCDRTAQPQCSTDCTTILLCSSGNENPIFSIKCNSDAPFCDKGICTKTPGQCSNLSPFLCTSAGVFPEPYDCSRYHYCSESGSTSIEYQCQSGNIFNSKLKVCQRGVPRNSHSSRKICEKISCTKTENGIVIFPANAAFYVFCFSYNGVSQGITYKCADEENQVFDKETRGCIFNCKSSGYFPDSLDCSRYYICDGHKKISPSHLSCPPGYYYKTNACINNSAHCPPGSLISAVTPTQPSTGGTTQVVTQKPTEAPTNPPTEITTKGPTEITTGATTQTITERTTVATTDVSTEVPYVSQAQLPPISSYPYPSISFLPCPIWVNNDEICTQLKRLTQH